MNKKGLLLIDLFENIFYILFAAIMIGSLLLVFNLANTHIGVDIDVGGVNLQNITNSTFGKMNTAFVNTADIMGLALIFGMILAMFANAYFTGEQYHKLFIIIDIFILIFAFITSVYIQRVYDIFINASTLLSPIFIDNLPNTSKFILNLPPIVATIGVIMMIIGYSGLRRFGRGRDSVNVGVGGFN